MDEVVEDVDVVEFKYKVDVYEDGGVGSVSFAVKVVGVNYGY